MVRLGGLRLWELYEDWVAARSPGRARTISVYEVTAAPAG